MLWVVSGGDIGKMANLKKLLCDLIKAYMLSLFRTSKSIKQMFLQSVHFYFYIDSLGGLVMR